MEHALYGAQRAKEEAAKRALQSEKAAKRAAEREKVERAKEWSDEEVRMLEKALDKFPQVREGVIFPCTAGSRLPVPSLSGRDAGLHAFIADSCLSISGLRFSSVY